ncbi:hypothetical protein H072_10907 [Dactylellina haptotyla CBS 200.50]|uniref:alpha-L-rhamnosidase n=1 Tax=Dactylellina haptotyla (strain CBS 200.50) TaxID=1284197 RepID=S7ZYZ6_DACHA|nr:hypothetical protein H072_10907 [Dactylellina haptotyla CBS 200.50]
MDSVAANIFAPLTRPQADLPLEITNLRLSHTSNLSAVDDPTPSISWSYSTPVSSWGWRQVSYALYLQRAKFRNPWVTGGTTVVKPESTTYVAPRGAKSSLTENVPWPDVFQPLESFCLYRITVLAVLARNDNHKIVPGQGPPPPPLAPDNPGQRVQTTTASVDDLAKGLVLQLGVDAEDTITVSASLDFQTAIVSGGFASWQKVAPTIAPISTPWNLDNWNKPEPVSVFRKSFFFEKDPPRLARISATAFGTYKIYVNGKPASDTIMEPGWTEYKRRLLYQTFDVAEHLCTGENIITVFVADGWYRGRLVSGRLARRGVFGRETGFMALFFFGSMFIGDPGTFAWTGETKETGWRCTRTCPIQETELYDGEHYDARIKIDKFLDDKVHGNVWEDVRIMGDAFSGDKAPVLQSTLSPPIRCTEVHTVKDIIISPDGKKILDFGQNAAGRIRMKGSAPAGTEITFVHVEVLQPNGTPCTDLLRDAKATDRYIFDGSGVEEFEPEFTFHGFRYVQVHPWIEGLEIVAKVYGSDLPRGLKFESSYPELDRLVNNIQWSARANFLSICTDCPQRDERLGWTGDINAFGPTAVYVFDCQSFLRSWLHGLVDGQIIGGRHVPPLVSPNALYPPGSHSPNALWQDVLVTLPWYLYETYGDASLLRELFDAMEEYHIKGIPKDPATGLWGPGHQFGDWLAPSAPPDAPDRPATAPMFVADSWLCNITNTLVKIAKVLGMPDKMVYWELQATNLTSQWQSKYMLPHKSVEANNEKDEPPQILSQDTQTAHALALNFQLLPENSRKAAIDRLHFIVRTNLCYLSTGFAGTPELLHAICAPSPKSTPQSRLESISLAYNVLLGTRNPPSWLYPITMGATSIWERWDAVKPDGSVNTAGMTSLNHYAYGSVGRWIFENIGGIKMENVEGYPGGWKFVIDPIPSPENDLTRAKMIYDSPKGSCECTWMYNTGDGVIRMQVKVPGNCEADIRFLGKLVRTVGSGVWEFKKQISSEEKVVIEGIHELEADGWEIC